MKKVLNDCKSHTTTSRSAWRIVLLVITALYSLPISPQAFAQNDSAVAYSTQTFVQIADQMLEEADHTGKANHSAIERRLDSATILAVRTGPGMAELHTGSADEFFVVQGHATLTTGGNIVNPRGVGEVRGDSIQGGTRVSLKEGDVVHIPAKTPHQLLIESETPFVYVLVKLPVR